jgi:hypothetical protein
MREILAGLAMLGGALSAGQATGSVSVFSSVAALNRWLRDKPLAPIWSEVEGKVGYLHYLEVPAAQRGKGEGTRKALSLLEDARRQGALHIFLHAQDPMSRSSSRQVDFWSRLGFRKIRYDDGSYWGPAMMKELP